MKFNKQLAIIFVLLSMLLSAIATSVYFYNKNQETIEQNNQLVVIYVANEKIEKNTLIKDSDLKQTTIARQFVITKPLLRNEIIGKYAKETIYKNEVFLKEKLTNKIKVIKKPKTLEYKYSSYNISLKLFQNPNYSLKPDDIIKIVSVIPNEKNFSVQYVARDIRVLGFMRDGHPSSKSIIQRNIKNSKQEEIVNIKADEIVLDLKEDVILSLIGNYNRGKQLWMVKSKIGEKIAKKEEIKLLADLIENKKTKKKFVPKKKTYPLTWYMPKQKTTTKTATITYADDSNLSHTKKAKITSKLTKECSKTDKLLMVVANNTKLKTRPSFKAKSYKTVYKNYVISYKDVSKINNSWYVICDGSYINSEDVVKISYDEYRKLK